MQWFFLLLIFIALPVMLCAQDVQAYDDQGRRDPFVPLVSTSGAVVVADEDLVFEDMVLEGIAFDAQRNNFAIINGRVVHAQEHIGAYMVERIEQDKVILSKDQQQATLFLKKGGM